MQYKSMVMATQKGARIVRTPEVLGGKPRIEGRRISVEFCYHRVEEAGIDPHEVAEQHDLDVADVYRALAYYHEHPEEMAAVEAQREEREEQAAARSGVVAGPEDTDDSRAE